MPRKKLSDEERYQMLKQTGGKGKAKDQAYKAKRERIVSSVKKKRSEFKKTDGVYRRRKKSSVGCRSWK